MDPYWASFHDLTAAVYVAFITSEAISAHTQQSSCSVVIISNPSNPGNSKGTRLITVDICQQKGKKIFICLKRTIRDAAYVLQTVAFLPAALTNGSNAVPVNAITTQFGFAQP